MCSGVCNMGCQISYVFMVLKLVRSLGSLKTPKTVNVSIFGNGSKVNICGFILSTHGVWSRLATQRNESSHTPHELYDLGDP